LFKTDAEPWIVTCWIGGRVVVVASVELVGGTVDVVVAGMVEVVVDAVVDVVAAVVDVVAAVVDVVAAVVDVVAAVVEVVPPTVVVVVPPTVVVVVPPTVVVVVPPTVVDVVDAAVEDVVVVPAVTGTLASWSVGMLHVTDVWIAPFSTTAVVSLNALNVTAPEAGACTFTVIVGVVSVPGTNGPGVPVMNSSLAVAMVPSTAVSGVFAGVCGAAVGTMVAVPGFTIEPGMNEPPPWTW